MANNREFYPDLETIGKHYLVTNIANPTIKRHYTTCNAMKPQVYDSLLNALNAGTQDGRAKLGTSTETM